MLERVQVSGFALLRHADLVLSPGLTCISGESGAGKSLLFDAIAFACGGRTHRSLLAAGTASCNVTLTLGLNETWATRLGPPWVEGLNELTRRYASSGRAQSTVNGETVKAADAQVAGGRLIEITGQFEGATLFNPATHAALLDAFGSATLAKQFGQYSQEYARFRELGGRLATLRAAEHNRAQEVEFLSFQVAELAKAAIEPGERTEVESRLRLQQHGEAILRHAAAAANLLTGGDEGGSTYDLAAQAQRELLAATQLLVGADNAPSLPGEAAQVLEGVLTQLQDAAQLCLALSESVAFDAEAAQLASERLNEILRLERKFHLHADELANLLADKQRRLAVLTDDSLSPEETARQLEASEQELRQLGTELTKSRLKAAATMQKEAGRYFAQLEFPRCELQVEISSAAGPGPQGMDNIELLITLNPGEPPRPLALVASGGEASRLLLGLKAALADKLEFGVLLLDEIEAGLGGRTAQRVAEVLLQLAKGRQVLAITHLPVVAAHSAQHLTVRKHIANGRTEARIESLGGEARRTELARMLGGLGTAAELAVVDQLLSQAR